MLAPGSRGPCPWLVDVGTDARGKSLQHLMYEISHFSKGIFDF